MSDAERLRYLEGVEEEIVFVRQIGKPFVDIGCGPGWFLEEAAIPGSFGIEPCIDALLEARRRGVRCYKHLCHEHSIRGQQVSLIRLSHVIEHVNEPHVLIKDIRETLFMGGWLLLSTPDFGGAAAAIWGDRFRLLHDATHCNLFTNESMHRFLRDHGFAIERVTYPMTPRHWTQLRNYVDDGQNCSPPLPGSVMTFYARKEA